MENINSSAVVTYNNNFNDGQFCLSTDNQVNIINKNSDLKNGYRDEANKFEAKDNSGEVNLCCIAVKNGDCDLGGTGFKGAAKVSNAVEPKYVSIIDISSSPERVTVDSNADESLGSVYTNGDCVENGLKTVKVPSCNGVANLGTSESEENLGADYCLGIGNGLGSKESERLLGVQQFLAAENGAQVLNVNGSSSPNLSEPEDGSGSKYLLGAESGCNGILNGSSSSLNCRVSEEFLGSQHLLKAEIDHQKLHQTSSGTSDEDTSINGHHLSMSSKFSNHMNSLGSSSGYETDPNVSIVDVSAGPDEIMNPSFVADAGKVCRSADNVEDEVMKNGEKNEGCLRTDVEDEDDESSSQSNQNSSRNDGGVSKSNENSAKDDNTASKTNGSSTSHDDADEEDSKINEDSLMNDDDIDEAMSKSDEDSSKEDDDVDDKLKSNGHSLRNTDDETKSKGNSKSRGNSQESGQSMDVDDNDDEDEESSKCAADGGVDGNDTKDSSARTPAMSDARNSAANAARNSAINGTKNSAMDEVAVNGRNGVVHDDDDSCLDGYSSTDDDEDDVDAKMDNQQPKRPQLKRTRSNAGATDYWNEEGEDGCIVEFLDKSNDCAEARLAAKRQARAEAREIRMRELERQQREAEETADKVYDIYSTPDAVQRSSRVAAAIATPRSAASLLSSSRTERDNHRGVGVGVERENNSYHSSRRSSEDSLEEATSLRDMRHELKEVEDKFRKAMIANAQLDNEKASAAYQVELLKDRLEEMDENHSQLNREHRDKCRQFEALKRAATKLQEDLEFTRAQLEERDRLIEEQGLVIVGGEYSSSGEDDEQNDVTNGGKQRGNKSTAATATPVKTPKRALVSSQVAEVLQKVGSGSLDVRLKKFVEQRNELLDELNRVKLELEEERTRNRGGGGGANRRLTANGPLTVDGPCSGLDDVEEVQREANKLISDYKFRLQKADQDNNTLQATVARLETQVVRYKTAAEVAEKVEDDLKAEKRKLQREYRESQARVEELETAHSHLQKRLDKLKNAKSALLKEL